MTYRSAFILPAAIRDPANAFAAQIGIDPEGLLNTVSVPLVPDPLAGIEFVERIEPPSEEEPTHYGCCGVLTTGQRAQLEAASGSFPGAMWWRWQDTGEPLLVASHDGQHLGEPWSWEQCLAAAGVKRLIAPMPGSPTP